jgi:hypothetical protein
MAAPSRRRQSLLSDDSDFLFAIRLDGCHRAMIDQHFMRRLGFVRVAAHLAVGKGCDLDQRPCSNVGQ